MNRIVYALVVVCTLVSCAEGYSVQGSSSVSALDGSKLYLKTIKDNELRNIDSCEVVHGQFRFAGLLDTVRMANLFMDDESIMPIVLEKGEISIRIDNASQTVFGTPLNDRLYEFIDFHNQLGNQMAELSHKQSRMLLDWHRRERHQPPAQHRGRRDSPQRGQPRHQLHRRELRQRAGSWRVHDDYQHVPLSRAHTPD